MELEIFKIDHCWNLLSTYSVYIYFVCLIRHKVNEWFVYFVRICIMLQFDWSLYHFIFILTRLVIPLCTWVYLGYLLMNSKVIPLSYLKSFCVEHSLLLHNQLPWFSDMQFSFFLFSGYVGVSLLSPVMHNLWIWRVRSFVLIYIFK